MITEELVDEVEAPVQIQSANEGFLGNAPWWLISAGIHVVLLLGMTLFYIDHAMAVEQGEVLVRVTAPTASVVMPDELPRDVVKRPGIMKDDEERSTTEDASIFFPEAKPSDHNESKDNEDYHQMKGDSKDYLSYTPGESTGMRGRQMGKAPGVYDTLGVGSGGGGSGRYGGRFGGRENLVNKGGGSRQTEDAVLAALKWLAHHQATDGSWSGERFCDQCVGAKCSGAGDKDFDIGLTGLSLMAFLGAGYSHISRDEYPDPMSPGKTLKFGEVVKKGLQYLMARQDVEGCFGERSRQYMYNHCIATMAMSEALGMTGTGNLVTVAQKGVDFIVNAQNPGRGWRYASKSGDSDSSVTGWAVMALKSADNSDLKFPRSAYEGALAWYNEVTEQGGYYKAGYMTRTDGKVHNRTNESWDDHPAMSAVAVMARIYLQHNKREPALGSVQMLVNDLPKWEEKKVDFYYWYYASLALFQYDGPDGPMWKKWNEPMKNALVPNQRTGKDACQNGSWAPEGDRWGSEGGRVYATAINALSLEVYYRYPNVFGVNQGVKK